VRSMVLLFVFSVILVACINDSLSSKDVSIETQSVLTPITATDVDRDATNFACPHQEKRDIYFSSKSVKDTLDVQIVGEDCDEAEIVIRIISNEQGVVHETRAKALSYTYEDVGSAGVERMLESLVTSHYYENDLEDIGSLTEENGYYDVNVEVVIKAGKSNQPLFCHKAGKSYSNCYVFIDKDSTLIFASGS